MYGMQLYSQGEQKDTPFKIPSSYIEKRLYLGNALTPKIDPKNGNFHIGYLQGMQNPLWKYTFWKFYVLARWKDTQPSWPEGTLIKPF